MQGDSGAPGDVHAIAAAVFLADDAVAGLAVLMPAADHATNDADALRRAHHGRRRVALRSAQPPLSATHPHRTPSPPLHVPATDARAAAAAVVFLFLLLISLDPYSPSKSISCPPPPFLLFGP